MKFSNGGEEKFSLLKVHEWLAIAIVIGIVGGIACLTSFYDRGESRVDSKAIAKSYSGFDVLIKGAVDYPGIYHIDSEMKVKDLLDLAGVSPHADLRRFRLDTLVKKGRIINVPLRTMIKIHLKGAVKADLTLTMLKGSKVEDLLDIVEFSPQADLKALKKKRRLKSDEVIVVPCLKKQS